MVRIVTLEPEHAPGLAALQRACFPTLGAQELMTEDHFLSHYRIFPEGDFVALDGDKVVGLGSGFFIDFDFEDHTHRFSDIIDDGYYRHHDPEGDWYYGGDISVHPDFRGQGIGKRLYKARKDLVKRYEKRGIVAGGVLPGYARHKAKLSVAEYIDNVVATRLFDPTLSFQLKNGFEVRGLLENYLEDSASDNWAALIVWENPDYLP